MELSSFITSLVTSFVIFLVLMFLFAWLSRKPGNNVVYYPNRILKGLDLPDSRTRNPFSWIKAALSSTEHDVVSVSGVDTAVYFVFLSTALTVLLLSGILLLPTLLPIAATDTGIRQNGAFSELDKLSMGNVRQNSPRLWAYMIAVYWVSMVTYFMLWKAYKHVSELRAAALMSAEVRPEQFAVLVRDIPPPMDGETRKEQIESYFKTIYPGSFYTSMVITDNKKVNKIWKELEGYKKKLVRAEAVYTQSGGVRPTNRIGFQGLFGKKVDTIDYASEKINELIPKLQSEQTVTLRDRQLSSALLFFSSKVAAASAAQTLHSRTLDIWTVMDAPEPRQLIWSNLSINFYEREVRKYIVYFIVLLVILFYMIPIGIISAFTTLKNLVKLLPFIKPIASVSSLRTVFEAYLPQIALIVFLAMLPKMLMFLSKVEGIPSESHAVRAASGKYFYFMIFNVFIGVTIGGTLFGTLKEVEGHPNRIVSLLAQSLPDNATFFLTYVALKFFVGYGLELSRIVPLIIFHLKKKYVCKTEADIREAWAPADFKYATRVPGDLLILTIVLCYSVIAPLIIVFGVIYFALGWLVLRNQALNVYVPSYETCGRMWPHLHTRFLAALLLYQVTMLGYFGVKAFHFTPMLIPLPVITVIFAVVCRNKFYRFFQCTALEVASHGPIETPNIEHIYRSYIPPSLSFNKFYLDRFRDV
ncbi:hypothetical protein RND81_07G166400 [Saponaria officinalis]|uniref:CSC1-like protein ERD4 n=1 Tax=Saponaria officinalis TaxID=3572 RepID=A0AAW1JSS5_SAPOF